MKTFDEIYEELQNGNNNELNNLWQEAKNEQNKANKISLIICLIIDICAMIIIFNKGINLSSILFILPILAPILIVNLFVVIIANIAFSKNTSKFSAKYKQIVIKKLINNFYNNVEYFPYKEMPEYIYEKLEYEYYDSYESDDYLEAQINNEYSIQMAEVHTIEEQEYEDSEGETQTREITKFNGLFAKILINKSINSELKIMQDGELLLNKKLKMDSSEFEKYFDVQASNQIIGMQILTADVMEELVNFENKTKMKFDIYIKGNELYLRFHSGEMFEPASLKKGPLDKKTIEKYFYMLNFTYNLSNMLIELINNIEI